MAPTGRFLTTTGVLAVALGATPLAAISTSAKTGEEAPSNVLIVQDARGGSLVPVDGSDGEFELTLEDVGERAVWFTDQPRKSGHLRHETALDAIGFDDTDDQLNAVLSIADADAERDTVALTLSDAEYDPDDDALVYHAEALSDVTDTGLAAYAADLDETAPEEFDEASLFVDDENGRSLQNYDASFHIVFTVPRPDQTPRVSIVPKQNIPRGLSPPPGYQCVDDENTVSATFKDPGIQPPVYVHLTIKSTGKCATDPSYAFYSVDAGWTGTDIRFGNAMRSTLEPLVATCESAVTPIGPPCIDYTRGGAYNRRLDITIPAR